MLAASRDGAGARGPGGQRAADPGPQGQIDLAAGRDRLLRRGVLLGRAHDRRGLGQEVPEQPARQTALALGSAPPRPPVEPDTLIDPGGGDERVTRWNVLPLAIGALIRCRTRDRRAGRRPTRPDAAGAPTAAG